MTESDHKKLRHGDGETLLFGSSNEHVASMKESKGAYRVLVGRPERRDHSDDLGVDGRVILK